MLAAVPVLLVLAIIVVWLCWRQLRRRAPGSHLRSQGELTGRSLPEIVALIGPPTSRSLLPRGNEFVYWQVGQDSIAILFDQDGKFLRITRQHASTDH